MSDTTLRFRQPEVSQDAGDTLVRLPIEGHIDVEFRVRGGMKETHTETDLGNLCLAVGVIPAMRLGVPLRLDAPVCSRMLANVRRVQLVFSRWYPKEMTICEIGAEAGGESGRSKDRGTGAFFSGGVDSLFSVRRELGSLTDLMFVQGFDIPHDDTEKADLVRPRLEAAADEIGVPLREVWTNIRAFSEPLSCYWGQHFFGAALASVSHLLAPAMGTSIVPGSTCYDDLIPWGSHVVSDPLWGSADLELIHHGPEASRTEKIQAIADWPIAQRHLRVCWQGESDDYNCGRCEKCCRTLAALRAIGAEEDFAHLFDAELDLEALAKFRAPAVAFLALMRDILRHAEMNNAPQDLIDAVRTSSEGSEAELTIKRFANHNNAVLASSEWQRLLPKVRNKLFRSISESDPEWFVQRLEKILPTEREAILDLLHEKDPKWLRKGVRKRRWRR